MGFSVTAVPGLAFLAVLAAIDLSDSQSFAARVLLAEMLARPPVAEGQPANQPAMSGLALEACLRQARELDRTGLSIDIEIAAIDRLAAEGMFMQRQLDAELSMLGSYDEAGLNDFQRRTIRHEQLASKFQREFPLYQQHQKDYDAAVAGFDRDCSNAFAAAELVATKSRLGIK